jgi:hypothetical protein
MEVRGKEAMAKYATGAKMHERENKGGRPSQDDRDEEMALEFLRRLSVSKDDTDAACRATDASRTTITRQIGHGWDLKPTAAFDAIKRGLALLAAESSNGVR